MQALSMAYCLNSNISTKQLYVLSMHIYASNKIDCKDTHQTRDIVNYGFLRE